MEKENIIYKWYCKSYHTESIKMQVIKDFGDGQTLCQAVFKRSNGDEVVSGEKIVVSTNQLFDEPLEVVTFNKAKDRLEEEREKLRQDLDVYKKSVKSQIDTYKKRVAWLKRVEKESHPDKIKEMIRIMYMLLDSENLYLFIPRFNSFEIIKFNMMDCNNPFFNRGYDDGHLKLLCLYPDVNYKLNREVQLCLSEYSDGSGDVRPIKLFNKIQDLRKFVVGYIDGMSKIDKAVIEFCEEWQIPIPKQKVLDYYQSNLRDQLKSLENAKNNVAHYQATAEKWQNIINQINAQED